MGDETYRAVITGRQHPQIGTGACSVLVLRIDSRVHLLIHGDPTRAVSLTPQQAHEAAGALSEAADNLNGAET